MNASSTGWPRYLDGRWTGTWRSSRLVGLKALPPLTGPVRGPVWELRSRVEGVGLYRFFYYRDGEASFRLFYAYQKKDEKLPDHVRTEVMKRHEQLTGRKL